MQHLHTHRFTRFTLTLLTCGLLWAGLGRVSLADDLFASDQSPEVKFDDTDSAVNPDWLILADLTVFAVINSKNSTLPFRILPNAPSSSIVVQETGNVGLGTEVPSQKLHLVKDFTPTIRMEQLGGQIGPFPIPPQLWDLQADNGAFLVRDGTHDQEPLVVQAGAPDDSLVIGTTGNLGLKTPVPQGNLHIFGQANKDIFNGMGPDLNTGPAFNFGYSGNSFGPGSGFFNVRGTNSGVNPSLRFATINQQRMIITNAGRVGIGTTSPGVALDVVGTVRASTSIMVGGQSLNVPDYVFEPGYQLMPLTELGAYVAKEKHLPDIPSAQEIKAQGVNLSELQMQLLKKVEELTLYTLKQEQTIREQGRMLRQLTARLATVERARKK